MTDPTLALRQRFLESARATLDRLQQYATLLSSDPRDSNALENLRRDLHRLRGSSGSYGFDAASARLGQMEERVKQWVIDQTLEAPRRGGLMRELVDALHTDFGAAPRAAAPVGHEVWCVDTPSDRTTEWSRIATTTGLRFVAMRADEFAELIQQRTRPYAVIAPTDVGRALPVPDGLPLVLLASSRPSLNQPRSSYSAVTIVDRNIAADDLLVLIEQLELRTAVAGGCVVILDDDPMILVLTQAICRDAGLRAVTIDDPTKLFDTLEEQRPAVLLMDVQLPNTSGYELTRRVRASAEFGDLPIILFSANTTSDARNAAIVAGADAFLAKPVAPAELRTQLSSRMEQVRALRLAHGKNPATGLNELEQGAVAAEPMFGALRRTGGVLTTAMVRMRDTGAELQWPNFCVRLARLAHGIEAQVAHYDPGAVVVTGRMGFDALQQVITAAKDAEGGSLQLVVGLAEARMVSATNPADLWYAAGDAARVAIDTGEDVHTWTPADSTRAPDVIIVEDDSSFSELLEFVFRQDGYTFRVLRNGQEALETLRTIPLGAHKPLVLLDLDLPGLDGHTVHEHLRLERPRDFVVVIMSVHAGDADQVRALRAGAADYLLKPVSLRVLMSKVPRWVRQPRSLA